MKILTIEERLQRLEKCFLGFAALVTGEIQEATKDAPQDFDTFQANLASEMREMNEYYMQSATQKSLIV